MPLSFIPSMLTVDPENDRIYAQDGGAGRLAALGFDPEKGLSTAWTVEQRTLSFTTLIGPPDARVIVGTDITRANSQETVVWRDVDTGRELARSEPLPTMTPGVHIPPAYDGGVYYLGFDRQIIHLLLYSIS